MMGSHAGFSAVPYPDQRRASLVAGNVGAACLVTPSTSSFVLPCPRHSPGKYEQFVFDAPPSWRFAPCALSIALEMSSDLGNPLPCIHMHVSSGRKPASSTATIIRWNVLVPPKSIAYAPGFITRRSSTQTFALGTV